MPLQFFINYYVIPTDLRVFQILLCYYIIVERENYKNMIKITVLFGSIFLYVIINTPSVAGAVLPIYVLLINKVIHYWSSSKSFEPLLCLGLEPVKNVRYCSLNYHGLNLHCLVASDDIAMFI